MSRQWRCYFCDEVFTRSRDAAEHFGVFEGCEADVPACKIAAHEGHLVKYIRKLEREVRRYQSDDSDVMRSIMTLEADHRQALIRAEEDGYGKGVRDASAERAAADSLVGKIEERFPNWRSYRDLVDCIDCTLGFLRSLRVAS